VSQPLVLARPRVLAALDAAEAPIRFVRAPLGAGKTAALRAYVAARGDAATYVRCVANEGVEAFRARTAWDAVAGELVADDVDRADPPVRRLIAEKLATAGGTTRAVLAGRATDCGLLAAAPGSRSRTIDADVLAFDAPEIAAVAAHAGIPHADADIREILRETEGWPLAVAAILADVAARGAPLANALEPFFAGSGRSLGREIRETIGAASDPTRAAFGAVARAPGRAAYELLVPLAMRGLFVRETAAGIRPYRMAFALATVPAPRPVRAPGVGMSVRLLGRCEAVVDGRPVAWIRRRDAQLFMFVLLRPGARATRAELRDAFWPGGGAHAANQSIRTACSNVRRAISAIAGRDRAARYFSSRDDVAIDLREITTDVHDFFAAAEAGERAQREARFGEARAAYRIAADRYEGPLLGADAPEPWARGAAQRCRERYGEVLARMAALGESEGRTAANG